MDDLARKRSNYHNHQSTKFSRKRKFSYFSTHITVKYFVFIHLDNNYAIFNVYKCFLIVNLFS